MSSDPAYEMSPREEEREEELEALRSEVEDLRAELERIKAAPVVVPVLTPDDVYDCIAWTENHRVRIDLTAEKINALIASRARTIGPGDVAVDRKALTALLDGCMVCNAEAITALHTLRTQATTSGEGEP
jgi:hypothetical protein